MRKLGVNIDHVATLRQARGTKYPDPVEAALIALSAGADGITLHLREDRRHIQDRDLKLLREMIPSDLNLEMAATQEMLRIAMEIKPDKVTLVPEKREELTTEGGLNVSAQQDTLASYVTMLKEAQIEVSLFVDPDIEQIRACHRLGVSALELNTARYCEGFDNRERERQTLALSDAAKSAAKLRMQVAAGHGLDRRNLPAVKAIAEISEFNIGHSIVSRAVILGLSQAVREIKSLLV